MQGGDPTRQIADGSLPHRRLLLFALATAIVALALLAAGCGGPSPEERFAQSACSTTLRRAQVLLETFDDVQLTRAAPGPDARVTLWALTRRGKEVARKLRAELRELPAPETDAGREAANYLDNFARLAFEVMAAEERRVRRLPENITLLQSIRSLQRLELELVQAFLYMTSAHRTIMTQVPELKEPFEKADSCKELDALGTD